MFIKTIKKIITIILIFISIFTLSSCDFFKTEVDEKEDISSEETDINENSDHTHTSNNNYSYDESGHYLICSSCNEHYNYSSHTYTTNVKKEATHTKTGTKTYTCSVCGYSYDEVIPVTTTHTYNVKNTDDNHKRSSATCSSKATYFYSCECGAVGTIYYEVGDYSAHSYDENDYKWNSDGKYVTYCKNNCGTYKEYTGSLIASSYSVNDSGQLQLNRSSYITNTTPYYDIDEIIIKFSVVSSPTILNQYLYGFGDLYYITDTHYIDNPFSYSRLDDNIVSSEVKIDLTNTKENYFSIYSNNTYLIESISVEYQTGTYTETHEDFTLNIISTNDIHGTAVDTSSVAGLKKATTQIDKIKQTSKYNLLLDQGDIYQGSAEVYMTNGYIMDDFLMLNGYDSTILGNHEWDWGVDFINNHIDYLKIPILTNNVYKDGELLDGLVPYKVIERCGVKIGIIGSIGDVYLSISSSKTIGYNFLTGQDLTNRIIEDSNALKALGCEFIILQLHDGTSNYDTTLSSGGYVDLVLEGHTHEEYANKDDYGVYHIQCYGDLGCIYKTTLQFKYVNNKYTVTVNTPYYYLNSSMLSNADSELMSEIDDYYYDNYYYVSTSVVVNNMPTTTSTELDEYSAEAYYNVRSYLIGTEYEYYYDKIVLGGGFIKERCYDKLSGSVTYSKISEYYPFDNDMCLCSIKGKTLKSRFLSDVSNYHVYVKDGITKSSIKDNETYYIICDSYSLDYTYNYLTLITYIYDAKYPRDVLIEYLKDKFN